MERFTLPTDKEQWELSLHKVVEGEPDVYFRPGLLSVYAEQYGATAEAVFHEDADIAIFYPYLLRDLRRIPALSESDACFDVTTLYGYGGPLVKKKSDAFLEGFARFRNLWQEEARSRSIVSEFIRFHPVLGNHVWYGTDASKAGSVALIDLSLSLDTLFAHFAKDKQRGVRKAEKLGVEVEIIQNPSTEYLKEFLDIYVETMDKNKAEQKYYFTIRALEELRDQLGHELSLARGMHGGTCIASYLVFESGPYLTNYLSGHHQSANRFYAKQKIIFELMRYGQTQGHSFYNLGGGRPSLFSFKAAFATTTPDFYIGKIIHLPNRYAALAETANVTEAEKEFFPAYRHPRLYDKLM